MRDQLLKTVLRILKDLKKIEPQALMDKQYGKIYGPVTFSLFDIEC